VVLDNRQAKILVGKQVSVASTTYPNNAGGTTTASPYVTFDRVNVALHLYVRPQITRGRGIQLQIDQGNDTLDPASVANSNNPTFKISSIVTSVHVESGDIVVLGGLTQDSLGNDNNRLPILGDIPGIGRLFQKNVRNREKRVLMVFIRPIILRNERDTVQVSGGKYNDVRQYQLDWLRTQEYHDDNGDTILPPLKLADLPKPFSRHPQKAPPIFTTK
jgi:general secretion pathway protein D